MHVRPALSVGSVLRNTRAFVTPIGCQFAAGTDVTVIMVGSVNARVQDQHGSTAWVQLGAVKNKGETVDPHTAGFYLAG
jgi:hypothetical protein